MADDIDITPGVGKTVATDDCTTGHVQLVKIAYGANGDRTQVGADANGLDVDVTRLPTDPFGANADAASATGSISAKLRFIAGTGIPVTGLPALAAGTNNIGDVDVLTLPALPAGTNNIGDVDVLSVPAPLNVTANGSAAAALRVTIANDSTGIVALTTSTASIGKLAANSGVDIGDVDVTSLTGGTIAHDSVDSGNPIKVGARAAALAASVTLVAAADRTDNVSDLDGALITRPYCQLGDIVSDVKTVTDGSSTAFTGSFAATANVRNYITALSMWNTSATVVTVDIRDGTAGSVIWTGIVPAGGGNNVAFNPPLRQPTVNTALAMDPSASATTVGCSVTGFKSKA